MRRIETETDRVFKQFLALYNRFSELRLPPRQAEDLSSLEDPQNDFFPMRSDLEQLKGLIEILTLVKPKEVDANTFYNYLFGEEGYWQKLNARRLTRLRPAAIEQMTVRVELALAAHHRFHANFRYFQKAFANLESMRIHGRLPRNGKLFSLAEAEIVVTVTLNSKQQTDYQIPSATVLHGFQDFARISRCPQCKNVFLRPRTDSEYCNSRCKTAFNQARYLSHPEKHADHNRRRRDRYAERHADPLKREDLLLQKSLNRTLRLSKERRLK